MSEDAQMRDIEPVVCDFILKSLAPVMMQLQGLVNMLTPIPKMPKPVELENRECMLALIRKMSGTVLVGEWKKAKSQCFEILEELILLEADAKL